MGTWLIIIIAVLTLIIILIYNSIVFRKNQVGNAFASIDTMLKKRHDMIPALVETVKGYMNYEKSVFENLTSLRTDYLAGNVKDADKINISEEVTKGMGGLFVVAENYPELKASENFLKLQAAWNEMEDQVAASRRFYNSAVTDYHNSLEMFPSNLIARMMKLEKKPLFTLEDAEKAVPSTIKS